MHIQHCISLVGWKFIQYPYFHCWKYPTMSNWQYQKAHKLSCYLSFSTYLAHFAFWKFYMKNLFDRFSCHSLLFSPCSFPIAARFSPDDKYSRQRVLLKKRFGLLPTQKPPQKYWNDLGPYCQYIIFSFSQSCASQMVVFRCLFVLLVVKCWTDWWFMPYWMVEIYNFLIW